MIQREPAIRLRLSIEDLEDRVLLSVLPAPSVSNRTQLTSSSVTNQPETGAQVAMDPRDSMNLIAVASVNPVGPTSVNPAGIRFWASSNGGITWTSEGFEANRSDPGLFGTTNLEFTRNEHVDVAFDRQGFFYVVSSQHDNAIDSGSIVFGKYRFDVDNAGSVTVTSIDVDPFTAGTNPQRLYSWFGGVDRAYNPVVGIDTNLPTFTDPATGATQTDTLANTLLDSAGNPQAKAIYVAWNTVVTQQSPLGTFPATMSEIVATASGDGGVNFTTPQWVSDHDIPGAAPQIAFSQGSADGLVPGGRLMFFWSATDADFANYRTSTSFVRINSDFSSPDGGSAAQAVASAQVFVNTGTAPTYDWVPTTPTVIGQTTDGSVSGLTLQFGGVGYPIGNNLDIVTISDPPPTTNGRPSRRATARATVVANAQGQGVVTAITLTDPGLGYTSVPTVTIGGGGLGAVVVATVNPRQTSAFETTVNITDPHFGTLADIDVTLNLDHARLADLTVTLTSPTGISVDLMAAGVFGGRPAITGGAMGFITGGTPAVNRNIGTVFDSDARRDLRDGTSASPFIGNFRPDGSLDAFNGLSAAQLNGVWRLSIVDTVASNVGTLRGWSMRMASHIDTPANVGAGNFGTDTQLDPTRGSISTVTGSPTNVYTTTGGPYGTPGVGPGVVVAVDNTLGSFSPFQGTIYVAYTGGSGINTNIFLTKSTDFGVTWEPSIRVNDDDVTDFFSEGTRSQFMPNVVVDPTTGTLVLSYYDGRYDASLTRVANSLTTSIDGGETFSDYSFLNPLKTAINAINGTTVEFEPIPGNQGQAGVLGFGDSQGLVAYGGRVIATYASNLNAAETRLMTAVGTIAAGPRVDESNSAMGPLLGVGTTPTGGVLYNATLAGDGRRQLDGFVVTFDRPIDPATFGPTDLILQYVDPYGNIVDLSSAITSVAALDQGLPHGPRDLGTTATVSMSDAILIEGNAGTRQAQFSVMLSMPNATDVTVRYSTVSGTANAGSDYTAVTFGTVVIPAGTLGATFSVNVLGDALAEGNEAFSVSINNVTAPIAILRSTGVATILDDEPLPTITIGDAMILEGDPTGTTTLAFPVFLSTPAGAGGVTVQYTSVGGTATSGTDYVAVTNTLNIPAGQSTGTINVSVNRDKVIEGNESFVLNLTNAVRATIARTQATGTIVDDDALAVSTGNVTVRESSTATNATITFALNAVATTTVRVNYTTAAGSAVAGIDYTTTAGFVDILPGTFSATVDVPILNDAVAEGIESFVVNITSVTGGASLLTPQATVTIIDDDTLPSVSIGDGIIREGNGGTSNVTIPVFLSYPLPNDVTVNYTLASITAQTSAPADFNGTPGSVVIPAGTTSASFTVAVIGDTLLEDNETFSITIASATGTISPTIGRATGFVTIVDNEIGVSIGDATVSETTNTVSVTITLDSASMDTIRVSLNTAAAAVPAITTNITTTTWAATNVATINTATPHGLALNQTVVIAGVADATYNGTFVITGVPTLNSFTFALTPTTPPLAPSTGGTVTIQAVATGGGTDFTNVVNQLITFNPGQTSQVVNLPIIVADTLGERNEHFFVTISNPILVAPNTFGNSSVVIGRSQGIITIVDDDTGVAATPPPPALRWTLGDASVQEGSDGNVSNLVFPFFIVGTAVGGERATFALVDVGSATVGVDYVDLPAAGRTIILTAGQTSGTITVPILGDQQMEPNEQFLATLTLPIGSTNVLLATGTGVPGQAVGTILDDDHLNVAVVSNVVRREGDGGSITSASEVGNRVTITSTLAHGLSVGQTVVVSGVTNAGYNGTFQVASTPTSTTFTYINTITELPSSNGGNFTAPQGLTFNGNVQTATEAGNIVTITTNVSHGLTIGQSVIIAGVGVAGYNGTFTVASTPNSTTFTYINANVGLGASSGGTVNSSQAMTFTAVLSNPRTVPTAISLTTSDGTAVAPNDYSAVTAGTLTIPASTTTPTVNLVTTGTFGATTIGDKIVEGNESFNVTPGYAPGVVAPAGFSVDGTIPSTGILLDDDALNVSISDITLREGSGGVINAVFTIYLNAVAALPIVINYTTVAGTAQAGSDFGTITGNVTIPLGGFSATVSVPIVTDSVNEPNESFFVRLNSAVMGATTNLNIARPLGVATILNDDLTPALTVNNSIVREGNTGTVNSVFTVFSSFPIATPLTFQVSTGNDSAVAPGDYTALSAQVQTILALATSTTFTVAVNGDAAAEGNEEYRVILSNPSASASFARSSGVGTIVADDAVPTLSVSNPLIREGDGATNPVNRVTFTVLLSAASTQDVSFQWATTNGTGLAGVDYIADSGLVTILAGQTSGTFSVEIIGDSAREGLESFNVTLSNAIGATFSKSTGTATIIDDDGTIGATQFLVSFAPQGGAGTYRYAVGPNVSDRLRDPQSVLGVGTGGGATDPFASSVFAFSSQFSSTSWSAAQATGVSNVPGAVGSPDVDDTRAWSPLSSDGGTEFIDLRYAIPVFANGVIIRETLNPGFVTRVDLVDINDVYHTIFAGVDPSPSNVISNFTINFPTTAYLVKGVKVFVNSNHVLSDWEEIDSVQLLGSSVLNSTTAAGASNTNLPLPSAGTGGSTPAGDFSLPNDDVTVSTIDVSGLTGPVTDVNVNVQIDYPVSGDLEMRLVAPDGTIIGLVNQRPAPGTGGNYFLNVTFDDQAGNSFATAPTPYTTVRPESFVSPNTGLSSLTGMVAAIANGTWTLQVKDNNAANVGTLVGWSLVFNSTGAVAPSGNLMDQNANAVVGEPLEVSGTITGATDASPIVITSATPHGLATGAQVIVSGVTGNTAANGTWSITRISATQFSLSGSSGNASYLGGGTWRTPNDVFAIPRSANTTVPFTQPYADETLPLIVPGPHMVSSSIPGSPATPDNLVLNKANGSIDITFDRDMLVSSFTPSSILQIVGPSGAIPLPAGSISITPLSPTTIPGLTPAVQVARSFRVSFPPQALSGTYNLVFAPSMQSVYASGSITDAANADPLVITTATPHGLRNGAFVTITGVGGNFGANGTYTIANVTATSFTLNGTVGNGDYTPGTGSWLAVESVDTNLNAGLDVLRGATATVNSVQVQFPTAATGLTIPANGQVSATLTIADAFLIKQSLTAHIALQLKITHQNIPDLEAQLIAPDGTIIQLFNGVGVFGSSPHANMNDTILDDFAATPIQNAGTPIGTGPFNPQLPLSALDGRGSAGVWRLVVTNRGSLAGVLDRWSLYLPKAAPSSGLGEVVADRFSPHFRIFTQDPANSLTTNSWTAMGPASQTQTTVNDTSGRVGAMAVDPSDPTGNTVYIGGATGGVWKTTNFLTTDVQGPTYVNLTDLGQAGSLNIGSIAVFGRSNDPNQSIIFVATGDGDTIGAATGRGVGFLRSMDGGRTWQVLDSTNNIDAANPSIPGDPDNIAKISSPARNHHFVGASGFKIIVDPVAQPSGEVAVYAAMSGAAGQGGVWRSLDTGKTWQPVRLGNATDVVLAAGSRDAGGNLDKMYAGFRGEGVFFSASARSAVTMVRLDGNPGTHPLFRDLDFIPDQAIPVANATSTPTGVRGRILLTVPTLTNNPLQDTLYQGWLYALVVNTNGTMDALYLTKDFGQNWTRVRIPGFNSGAGFFPTNDETRPDYNVLSVFGNYASTLVIDPNDPNVVYIGGTPTQPATVAPQLPVPTASAPASGVIRVDVTTMSDPYSLVAFDHSDPTSTLATANVGPTLLKNVNTTFGILDPLGNRRSPYINLLRDPDAPFTTPSSLKFRNVASFRNEGTDVRWAPLSDAVLGSQAQHEMIAIRDPISGQTRLIFGDDQGVFTGVAQRDGTFLQSIGGQELAFGARSGNLQLAQFNYGAAQPSILAADIAGAMFYGMATAQGYPVSAEDIISTGNLNWSGVWGNGAGVVTDQTGSGSSYQYRIPNSINEAGFLPTDFFVANTPPAGNIVSRTTGLVQPGDNPGQNIGQWPFESGGNFAINPIDRTALVISAPASGRIFRTNSPSTGEGRQWFAIGTPSATITANGAMGDVDNLYKSALAFGAPSTALPGITSDFIYAGSTGGRIYVTMTGGGPAQWRNISGTGAGALDASQVMAIIPNPRPNSKEVYAITQNGVYWMADSSMAVPTWTKLNEIAGQGNLLTFQTPIYSNKNDLATTTQTLTSMAIDWRYAIPDAVGTGVHPVLYVSGVYGVFRSLDKGITWTQFPAGNDEVQTIAIQPTVTSIRFNYNGVNTSAALTFSPITTASALQTNLATIPALAGNVSVTGVAGGPFTVRFTNALASSDAVPITFSAAVGGTATITETTRGVPVRGYLPMTQITDLDLVLGNTNTASGFPDESAGLNMLVATSYGRGTFAIRMDNSTIEQYAVTPRVGPRITASQAGTNAINLTFNGPVDQASFNESDVVLNERQTITVTDPVTTITFSYNGVQATSALAYSAATTAAQLQDHLITIPALITNEQQTLTIPATAASVTFNFNGIPTTAPLAYTVTTTAAQVLANLQTIPALSGNITVSGANGGPFVVTFNNALKGKDVIALVPSDPSVTVTENIKGGPNIRVTKPSTGVFVVTFVHKLAGQDTALLIPIVAGTGSVSVAQTIQGGTLGLLDPNGNPINPTSIVEISSGSPNPHNLYQVNLPGAPVTPAPGFYNYVVGPNMSDFSGNRMDQDVDRAKGEVSDDMFSGRTLFQGFANLRPSLATAGGTLPTILEDEITNMGIDLATWIAGLGAGALTDGNDGSYLPGVAPRGIAVTSADNTFGRWQYAIDAYDSNPFWINFGTTTAGAARLLEVSSTTRIRFVPNANFNSTIPGSLVQFTFKAWDLTQGTIGGTLDMTTGGAASASYSTASATGTISVTAINDAPVNTIPATQTIAENTTRVFSTANGNRIAVGDVDDADNAVTGDEVIQVTLTSTNGTLSLNGIAGLSFAFAPDANGTPAGDGTNDTTMTFRGSLSSVNAALSGMSFTPVTNFFGTANVAITTKDLGNFGTGGNLTDTDNFDIVVTLINDPPVNSVPATQTTAEDTPRIFSAANGNLISISDFDDGDNAILGDESVQVTLTGVSGTVTLGSLVGLSFAFPPDANGAPAGDGSADASMTFRGTIANVNLALAGLSFAPTLNFVGAATLTITTNDLGNFGIGSPLTDADTIIVNVTAVNDAPVNIVPAAQTTQEDTALIFSTANSNRIAVGDVDDADNAVVGDELVQVTLTSTNGVMTLSTTAGLDFLFAGDANGSPAGDGTADAVMTFRGTLTNVNIALNGMSFLAPLHFNGPASITILSNDLGRFGAGVALTDSDTVSINVTAVNDAPVNSVPGAQTIVEDTVRTFNVTNGNLISIADIDDADNAIAGDETMQVTLTAANGTISLSGIAGLNFSFITDANGAGVGDGTADATMTFRGARADINTALAGLTFTPTLNFVGANSLSIVTKDLGNFGAGGNLTDTDTIAINVTPLNDAPVNVVPATQNKPEDVALVFSTANANVIAVSDVDDADNAITGDEIVQVTLNASNGVLTLSGVVGLDFAFTPDANGSPLGDGTADSSMTFRGTLANVNAALQGMSFVSPLNYNGPASVTMTSVDLGNFGIGVSLTDTDTVLINVTPVNDAPLNTIPVPQFMFEDTTLVFSTVIGNRIFVGDSDDADNVTLGDEVVQVTLTATNGVLTLNGIVGLSFNFPVDADGIGAGDGTDDATMTFRGTLTDVNAALDGLKFIATPNRVGLANIAITTKDLGNIGAGGTLSDTDNVTITINPVNDLPLNSVPVAPQSTPEEVALVFSTANSNLISIGDVDDSDNAIAGDEIVQVTLTAVNGVLTLSGTTGLDFTFVADANGVGAGDGTADASMTFRGTLTNVNAALSGMRFNSATDFNGPASVTIVTNDLGNFGVGGTLTDTDVIPITVTAVNDAPVNTVPGAQITLEDIPVVFSAGIGNLISVGDVDDAANAILGDEIVQVTLTAVRGSLTLNGIVGLDFAFAADADGAGTGTGSGDTTMTFRGSLTNVNAALNGMRFTPTLNAIGSGSVTILTKDLGNFGSSGTLSDSDTVAITINAVNDAPVNIVPATQTTAQVAPLIFSIAAGNQIAVSDVDDADNATLGDEVVQVRLTAVGGTLTLSGIVGLNFTFGDANGIGVGDGTADTTMTFRGTLNDVNAALNGLTYNATTGFIGAGSITIVTNDLGNFGAGLSLTDTDIVTINVVAANDAPVNTVPAAQTSPEDTPLVFSTGNGNAIAVGDPDDGDNAILGDEVVQVTLTATRGKLTLSSLIGLDFTFAADADGVGAGTGTGDITMTFRGTLTDVNAALNGMAFTPDLHAVGAASVGILTNDLGNFGIGGSKTDSDTVDITLTPVNDGPSITVPGPQVTAEDTAVIFSTGVGNAISVGDVDDADNAALGDEIVQVTLTGGGTFTLSAVAGLNFAFAADADGVGTGDGTADPTMTFRGTLSAVNAALNGLSFTPALNFVGTTNVTILVKDLGNFGTGGTLTATGIIAVTTTAVNDAPVNNLPTPQTVNEDTALVFSTGNSNRIFVGDADDIDNTIVGDEIVQVTLTAVNGTLTLSGIAGLDFAFLPDADGTGAGTGTGDITMTFRGTLADINSALNGMSFHPTANYFGPASVSIVTSDLAHFGVGTALTDSDTLAITVAPINDAPTFSLPANPPSVPRGAGLQTVPNFTTGMSVGPANESSQSLVSFNVTQTSTTGTVAFVTPPTIDRVTGALTYQATAGSLGTATFNVTLTDSGPNAPPPNVNTSAVQTFTIKIVLPSVTTAVPTPSPSQYGQPINIPVTVTGAGPTPTGAVEVYEGATLLATGTLTGGAVNVPLNVSAPFLSVGSHTLTVRYLGDVAYAPSIFTHVQTVNPANTTTVVSSVSPTIYGGITTFTATVSSAFGGVPTLSTVAFTDGGQFLGTGAFSFATANSITYTFTMPVPLAVGDHAIGASFAGGGNFAASTSAAITHSVIPSPTTSTLALATSSSLFGEIFQFSVTVESAGGVVPSGRVTFFNGAVVIGDVPLNLLGVGTIQVPSASIAPLPVGTHAITAVFNASTNFASSVTSVAQMHTVNKANTVTTVTSSTGGASVFGEPVTFSVQVASSSGGMPGAVTGSIDLYDGVTLLAANRPLVNGVATFTTNSLTVLSGHAITAVYASTSNFLGSTSAAITHNVTPASTTTTLTSDKTFWAVNQPVFFTATVVANAPSVLPPTGNVIFTIDGIDQPALPLSGGRATLLHTFIAIANHTVTARYDATTEYFGSSAAPQTQNVRNATAISLASSEPTASFPAVVTFAARVSSLAGTPTGLVHFSINGVQVASIPLDAAGVAAYLPSSVLSPGTYVITAFYAGDALFNPAILPIPLIQVIDTKQKGRLS